MTSTSRAEKKADKQAEKLARKQARAAEAARAKAEKQADQETPHGRGRASPRPTRRPRKAAERKAYEDAKAAEKSAKVEQRDVVPAPGRKGRRRRGKASRSPPRLPSRRRRSPRRRHGDQRPSPRSRKPQKVAVGRARAADGARKTVKAGRPGRPQGEEGQPRHDPRRHAPGLAPVQALQGQPQDLRRRHDPARLRGGHRRHRALPDRVPDRLPGRQQAEPARARRTGDPPVGALRDDPGAHARGRADRRDQQRRRLPHRDLHGPRWPLAGLQHPHRDVRAPAAPAAGVPRLQAHRRRPHPRHRRRPGGRGVRRQVGEQHRRQPARAGRQLHLPVVPVLAGGHRRAVRRAAARVRSPASTRCGSRWRPRPSAARRASWPPPHRRCSPRSAWCRATAAARSTSTASPTRPRRACTPRSTPRTSRPSSAS